MAVRGIPPILFVGSGAPAGFAAGHQFYVDNVTGDLYDGKAGAWNKVSGGGDTGTPLALAPSASGDFTVAHPLGQAPMYVLIMMTSSGAIWFQSPTMWDADNLYLVASDAGVTAMARLFVTGGEAVSAAPSVPGNFSVAHGLGREPIYAVIMMTSSGAIWFQSPTKWDSTNLYLVASEGGITAEIQVF